MQATILDAISSGLSRGKAAILADTTLDSVRRLAVRDRKFRESLKKAEVEFERKHLDRIARGDKGWQSSAWLLERKFWNRWGKHEAVAVTTRSLPADKLIEYDPDETC